MSEVSLKEDRLIDTPHLRLAHFSAPTDTASVAPLRDRLVSSPQEFSVRCETGQPKVWMAFEEAIANALYHGNLELDSSLKEEAGQFSKLAQERCERSPWKDRRIHVTELATPFGVWITLRDQGNGFNVQAALRRSEQPDTLLLSGRGLTMMRAFTDELFFNDVGNEVTLVFYRKADQDICELLQQRMAGCQKNAG